MFFQGSRYRSVGTYRVTRADGTVVTATRLPLPSPRPVAGYHPRRAGQRNDLLAAHYLSDPTATWVLCDTNQTMSPDALASRLQVAIPRPS